MAILAVRGVQPMPGALKMEVQLFPPDKRRRDVDNVLKSLLDALEHGGAYADDGQIVRLAVEKLAPVNHGKTIVRIQQATE